MFELRPIPGMGTSYAASSDGRVRSMARVVLRSNGVPMTVRARWLKPTLRHDGYFSVTVHVGDQQRKLLVHRLVAAAWLPPGAPTQIEINHKDAVKTNNAATNLEWCTSSENTRHAVALELIAYRTPARKVAAQRLGRTKRRLTDEQLAQVQGLLADGASISSTAKQFGVAWLTVSRIHRGETYRSNCCV